VLPTHAQVQHQIQIALRDHKRDVRDLRISFSPEGHTRALSQTVPGMDPWGPRSQPTHYLGLPFVVVRRQVVDVLVELSDGSPIERRDHR
jgi:hypothetical protein